MAIRQLSLTDFRNLVSSTIDFDARLNLIQGDNGSGKTSLLESIYVLCQARSFRGNQLRECIRHGRKGFLLFGRFDGFRAGLSRTRDKLDIRIDGEPVPRRSALVRRTPINIVNADSFLLIDGAPARRRAWLDWVLFHVEPEYPEAWRRFQHALRQRNRLLKDARDYALIDYWDQHLAEPSTWLQDKRRETCAALREIIEREMHPVLGGLPLEIEYRQGWRADGELLEVLGEDRQRDRRAGYTHSGIHRDDIVMTSGGVPLDAVLSRGQGKRVCLALILGVLRLVDRRSGQSVILLVDDLNSELDPAAREQVLRQLVEMPLQLFISNIDSSWPDPLVAKDCQVFHVEHGTIKPRISD